MMETLLMLEMDAKMMGLLKKTGVAMMIYLGEVSEILYEVMDSELISMRIETMVTLKVVMAVRVSVQLKIHTNDLEGHLHLQISELKNQLLRDSPMPMRM